MAHKWWVLTSVACGTFMATLDSSIVNIALPTLVKDLASPLTQVRWVIIVYLLVITCLLLPFGRLSDQYGRRRVFGLGFWIFVLGSILCSASPALGWLVLSRAIQALGAAMLMANGPAVITAAFPSSERGTALGTMAMVVSAGLISGPSIGGLLITEFGWRSIFLVNVPVGILGAILVYRFVAGDVAPKNKVPFDWVGAFLQTVFMFSTIVIFDPPNISVSGSTSMAIPRWVLVVFAIVVGAVFVKVESDVRAPLFDLSLLKDRAFWTANVASFMIFVALSSVSILMPFFLEEVMKYPPKLTGAFMTAVPLTILVVAPISGRLSDRLGSRGLSACGALIGALALLVMAGAFGPGITGSVPRVEIIIALASIGLALGLFQSPNNNTIMSSVPNTKLGVASALLATVRNLGLTIGTGLATGIFAWRMEKANDFVESLHVALFVPGLVALCAMAASLGKPKHQKVVK